MYQALYRKYRPKSFDEIVGQKYIVKTLKNAIINNKVNHAYMFFGPRGVGKTTMAKIFSRAVNCLNPIDGNPCNECSNCINSMENECVDIIEIDAASNNGVDEIREIRNKVTLVPNKLKYKVYIIDEVHMLTPGAFNALLKTLEEPPKHIIFVLATTDPQKVSDTIISRCQCFSFKRIAISENKSKMKEICEKEKIKINDDVIENIAIYSNGGLRDALGMLDKLYSYKDADITIEDFLAINDMVSINDIDSLYTNIKNCDFNSILLQLEKFDSDGKNIVEVMNQLMNYTNKKIIDFYSNKSDTNDIEKSELILQYICEKMFDLKKSTSPLIYTEMLLLNITKEIKNISREIFLGNNNEKQLEETSIKKIDNMNNKNIVIENVQQKESDDELKEKEIQTKKTNQSVNDVNLNNLKKIISIRVNNTFAEASKEEKSNTAKKIEILNEYVFDTEKGYLVSEILNSKLRAASKNNIIISYEYDSIVDQNLKQLDKINETYNELSNSNQKIAIISDSEWNNAKNRYIEFTKQGNKYKIKDEPDINDFVDEEVSESKSLTEMFGDLVEEK